MAETPSDQSRVPAHAHNEGPVILQQGFRPFFLLAGIWAALAMALWMASLAGLAVLPGAIDALTWHKHEMLFGFAAAAMAGFILTTVPNWTGGPPIGGCALACWLRSGRWGGSHFLHRALWGHGRWRAFISPSCSPWSRPSHAN